MSYWKGLMLAAVFDLIWIMGCPFLATEPETLAPTSVPAVTSPVDELSEAGQLEDSLMEHLQEQPTDFVAMEKLADFYASHGWYEAAIRPLARALQLAPERRSLWVRLDTAVKNNGRGEITDQELTEDAAAFVEALEMWGHGC
jgi:hypothetical protein